MQCKEWDDANSELFKESHDEAVHKNSYKSRLYELISASLEAAGSIVYRYRRFIVKEIRRKWNHLNFVFSIFCGIMGIERDSRYPCLGNGSLIIVLI